MRPLLLGFLLLLALAIPANAEERIERFHSGVTVYKDGSIDVVETIVVRAEGNEIKRGILRDFPTIYQDRRGTRIVVGFEVLSVARDGRREPYVVEPLSNGKRVRIGDAGVFLEHGPHQYRIAYRTTRQLGFFADFDELYWNVTGTGWTFAIDKAIVDVTLPAGAEIKQHAAYTGPQGASGSNFQVITASGNVYRAETLRRLPPNEGFTIAVAWQKGIVAAPTSAERRQWFLSDNAGLIALIAALLVAIGYYGYAWNRVGRDPPKGTIIPLFSPPAGIGPAAARYVWKQKLDDKGFAAALVGLAVKGRVRIQDNIGYFSIEKQTDRGPPLTRAETTLYRNLSGVTELKKTNYLKVQSLWASLKKALADEFEGAAFLRNIGWFWTGAAVSGVALLIAALFLPAADTILGLFAAFWTSIWWGVILAVGWGIVRGLFTARGIVSKFGSLFAILFLIPFLAAGGAVPVGILFGDDASPGLYMILAAAVTLGGINLLFFHLLRAPTLSGRKLLDQLEGFRMYMKTAEEERLKVLHPPEKTPALFERYLPYALALDCENEWNAKFAAVLAAAAAAGATAPLWYSGDRWDPGSIGDFTDSIGSSLASSVASAATAPGSSSGSSGGGSSGGGGGGGGGSGW